jgi:hypothetical protein
MSDCTFTEITAHGKQLDPCPICGHAADMWEIVDDHGVQKFACCGRSEDNALGPVDGCPLSHPPRQHFYMPTLREAAKRWNEFTNAAAKARTNTLAQAPQHVLKAEAATPDATDRGAPVISSPDGGPMGAGQPAAAGPVGRWQMQWVRFSTLHQGEVFQITHQGLELVKHANGYRNSQGGTVTFDSDALVLARRACP